MKSLKFWRCFCVGFLIFEFLQYPISGQVKDYKSADYPRDIVLVPHGLSVILTAPADFLFTAPACPERHLEAAKLLGVEEKHRKSDAGKVLADIIRGFMRDFGVANGLKAVGFDRSDIPKLCESALHSLSALQLAPKSQTMDEIAKIYEDSLEVY